MCRVILVIIVLDVQPITLFLPWFNPSHFLSQKGRCGQCNWTGGITQNSNIRSSVTDCIMSCCHVNRLFCIFLIWDRVWWENVRRFLGIFMMKNPGISLITQNKTSVVLSMISHRLPSPYLQRWDIISPPRRNQDNYMTHGISFLDTTSSGHKVDYKVRHR